VITAAVYKIHNGPFGCIRAPRVQIVDFVTIQI